MEHLQDLIPLAGDVLTASEESLAWDILQVLQTWERRQLYQISCEHFAAATMEDQIFGKGYRRPDIADEIKSAINQAWDRLVRTRLLVPDPRFPSGGVYKLGQKAREALEKPRERRSLGTWRLNKEALHRRLQQDVWGSYERAEYATAVLLAMKSVEVAVREAAGLGAGDIGTHLMRAAFNSENGPLTDQSAEKGERQARSDLFAGAIGSYKNPSSHRDVDFGDPDEVGEVIMLANQLLRIVDARKAALGR